MKSMEDRRPPAPWPYGVGDWAWLVLFGSLLGGVLETAARFLMYQSADALHSTFRLHPQGVWMAPLANVPLFAAALAVVFLAARKRRPRHALAFGVATALAVLEVILISQRVHPVALLILAAGVGTQAAWFARARQMRLSTVIRTATVVLLLTSTGVGLGWNLQVWRKEQRAMADLPPAAQGPSVLFVVLDTVRSQSLSGYGYELPTSPALDRLAREGVRFERAIATAPWTLPSHASMFTGRFPHELSVAWDKPLDGQMPTLAERMRAHGYATGGFSANLTYASYVFGLDRGFIRFEDYGSSLGALLSTSTLWRRIAGLSRRYCRGYDCWERKSAPTVTRDFLDWHETLDGRPYFAFLNLFDAHGPYDPPPPYDTMFLGRQPISREPTTGRQQSQEAVSDLQRAYDASIRFVDDELGRLLDELERRGALANTLVVVTSDHGEDFMEHGHLGHGASLYLTQLQVPLVILVPGRSVRNVSVTEPVSLRDIPATILDIVGDGPESFPGLSLARFWASGDGFDERAAMSPLLAEVQQHPTMLEPWYPVASGGLRSIIVGRWHYIRHDTGREELFDISADPVERSDLVGAPGSADVIASLRAALEGARAVSAGSGRAEGPLRPGGPGPS